MPFFGAIIGVGLSVTVALISLPTFCDAALLANVYFMLTAIEGSKPFGEFVPGRHG